MTAMMRQMRKQCLTIAAALALGALPPALAEGPAARIVVDPLTGVAIEGYDPVSYFTEPEPLIGLAAHEYWWGGVPWYFASAANRDVFIGHADSYAPQFGGHGAMSLSRGYLSEGKPRIHAIVEGRLYLFYSVGNREAFLMALPQVIAEAEAQWRRLAPGAALQ